MQAHREHQSHNPVRSDHGKHRNTLQNPLEPYCEIPSDDQLASGNDCTSRTERNCEESRVYSMVESFAISTLVSCKQAHAWPCCAAAQHVFSFQDVPFEGYSDKFRATCFLLTAISAHTFCAATRPDSIAEKKVYTWLTWLFFTNAQSPAQKTLSCSSSCNVLRTNTRPFSSNCASLTTVIRGVLYPPFCR